MQMPSKEKIIEILENEIDNYTELDPDGLDITKVETQVLRLAILYLKKYDELEEAKWIRLTGMAPPEYHGHKICSACEGFAPYNPIHPWREELSPYCPSCGAKMEVCGDD